LHCYGCASTKLRLLLRTFPLPVTSFGDLINAVLLCLFAHSFSFSFCRYGFVRYQDPGEANAAIAALDGTSVLGHTLQVKFADADAGPPSSGTSSGLTPSDSCYVKHLPAAYGVSLNAKSSILFRY
jgi:RNA recognition motif-containing protein